MDPNRRRQGGRGRRLDGGRIPQLPWAEVSNPYLPMEVLSADQLGQLGGGKDATQRATEIWKQALKEYEEPAMDPAIREALDAYVSRRRADIGSGEP